ncbi:hypothetical protein D3C80_866960 [compost metagenome]
MIDRVSATGQRANAIGRGSVIEGGKNTATNLLRVRAHNVVDRYLRALTLAQRLFKPKANCLNKAAPAQWKHVQISIHLPARPLCRDPCCGRNRARLRAALTAARTADRRAGPSGAASS